MVLELAGVINPSHDAWCYTTHHEGQEKEDDFNVAIRTNYGVVLLLRLFKSIYDSKHALREVVGPQRLTPPSYEGELLERA
jgi:hypothetical protein